MTTADHFRVTASALKRWAIGRLQDSLAVGVLWFVGLWIIGIPWTLLWAALAAALQIIPHFGPVLSLLGPVFSRRASLAGLAASSRPSFSMR